MAYQTALSAAPQQESVQLGPHQVSHYDPSLRREAVTRLIIGAKLPISFSENFFFQQFMHNFIPNCQTVSRVTIRSDIIKLFERKKLELRLFLFVAMPSVQYRTKKRFTVNNIKYSTSGFRFAG